MDIKIFNKKCAETLNNCNITSVDGNLANEIKKEILKRATKYKSQQKEKTIDQNKNYKYPDTEGGVF